VQKSELDAAASLQDGEDMPHTATENALRSHLRSHNSSVLMASGLALLFSTIGWGILYGASYWFTMVTLTVARRDEDGLPTTFNLVFFSCVTVLMLAAWIDQLIFPEERAVDERPPLEHFADILFFVPRFTLSCWQSLAALVSLRPAELRQAAELIELLKDEGKLALQQLPARFPNERSLRKVLTSLSIANVVAQRRDQSLTWLHLSPLAPEALRGPAEVQARTEDRFVQMPHVRTVEPRHSLPPSE
jgi:hypothetical protein